MVIAALILPRPESLCRYDDHDKLTRHLIKRRSRYQLLYVKSDDNLYNAKLRDVSHNELIIKSYCFPYLVLHRVTVKQLLVFDDISSDIEDRRTIGFCCTRSVRCCELAVLSIHVTCQG
jgi:hypothetical protein